MLIDIPYELYKDIKEIVKEYFEQDNAGTAMPLIHTLIDTEKVYSENGSYTGYIISGEEYSYNELCNLIVEEGFKGVTHVDDISSDIIGDYLMDTGGYCTHYDEVRRIPEGVVPFALTRKAIQKHIKNNKHHYTNPVAYTHHAWRVPEMDKLVEFLRCINNTSECQGYVEKMMVLSTAHVPNLSGKPLNELFGNSVSAAEIDGVGWIVMVIDSDEGIKDWLFPIMREALKQECTCILFDRDGNIEPSWKKFN